MIIYLKFDEKTKFVTAFKDGKETEIALVGAASTIPFKSDVKIKKFNEEWEDEQNEMS